MLLTLQKIVFEYINKNFDKFKEKLNNNHHLYWEMKAQPLYDWLNNNIFFNIKTVDFKYSKVSLDLIRPEHITTSYLPKLNIIDKTFDEKLITLANEIIQNAPLILDNIPIHLKENLLFASLICPDIVLLTDIVQIGDKVYIFENEEPYYYSGLSSTSANVQNSVKLAYLLGADFNLIHPLLSKTYLEYVLDNLLSFSTLNINNIKIAIEDIKILFKYGADPRSKNNHTKIESKLNEFLKMLKENTKTRSINVQNSISELENLFEFHIIELNKLENDNYPGSEFKILPIKFKEKTNNLLQ